MLDRKYGHQQIQGILHFKFVQITDREGRTEEHQHSEVKKGGGSSNLHQEEAVSKGERSSRGSDTLEDVVSKRDC